MSEGPGVSQEDVPGLRHPARDEEESPERKGITKLRIYTIIQIFFFFEYFGKFDLKEKKFLA